MDDYSLIETAREAWELVHTVIASRMVRQLARPGVCIDVDLDTPACEVLDSCRTKGISEGQVLREAALRFFNAWLGMRTRFPNLPHESNLRPWWLCDGIYLGVRTQDVGLELESFLPTVVGSQASRTFSASLSNWNEQTVQEWVIAIQKHSENWHALFDELKKKAEDKPETHRRIPPERRTVPMSYRRAA